MSSSPPTGQGLDPLCAYALPLSGYPGVLFRLCMGIHFTRRILVCSLSTSRPAPSSGLQGDDCPAPTSGHRAMSLDSSQADSMPAIYSRVHAVTGCSPVFFKVRAAVGCAVDQSTIKQAPPHFCRSGQNCLSSTKTPAPISEPRYTFEKMDCPLVALAGSLPCGRATILFPSCGSPLTCGGRCAPSPFLRLSCRACSVRSMTGRPLNRFHHAVRLAQDSNRRPSGVNPFGMVNIILRG